MPPPVQHSADDFQRFFQAKVQAVRDSTAAAASFMPDVGRADDPSGTFVLGTWRAVSSDEVRKLVMESPAKSCSLDPMPTYVLRDCLDALLPFLTALINSSLRDGHLPAPHKTAVVTPLLKKQSLDPQDVSNYRIQTCVESELCVEARREGGSSTTGRLPRVQQTDATTAVGIQAPPLDRDCTAESLVGHPDGC